ncbi:MAG: hypothetical protein SGBAC_001095 [Bacillariaceae sp.]
MRPLQSCLDILKEIIQRILSVLEKILRPARWNKKKEVGLAKVQVYILMGQSNMLGEGHVHGDKDGTLEYAVMNKGLYPYLIDEEKHWITSDTVRNVRVMDGRDQKMHVFNNEFLNASRSDTMGPEVGIGKMLEKASDSPIMLLKSCIGNRSLGWDLLPPGSKRYDFNDRTYAGYSECPAYWDKGTPKPAPTADWYAGKQYDTDIANAKSVLNELDKFYPNAASYEVKGFFWWQGDKDRYDASYATFYEKNLIRLIDQLRIDFAAPDAKFVLATLGQTEQGKANGNEKLLLDAMLAVDGNSGKHPEYRGNVSTIYSHPLSKGGASNGHYNGNAETYQNVGEAMGNAMVELGNSVSKLEV